MLQLYVILVVLAIYLYFKWHLSFFVRRGIAGPKPLPFVGNLWSYVTYKKHFGQVYDEIYRSYPNANYVGFYKLHQPAVLVRDLDIVKDVVAGDFSSFHDNDFNLDPKLDPLFILDPFFSKGDEWKALRNLLSPAFSYAKVKAYLPMMEEVCKNLVEWVENGPESKSVDGIETKSIGEMYTIDVVASCGFGVEGKSFTNTKSPFRKLIADVVSPSSSNIIKFFVTLFMPKIAPLLGISFVSKDQDAWVRSFVEQVIERRTQMGEKRQDFLQTFMDLKKKNENAFYAKDLLPAMTLTFLTEGTETSSSLISFALYELAKNPDVVRKAQEEVDAVYEKHGKITEEGMMELEYLEQILYETMRLHSAVFSLAKVANKDYTFPAQFPNSNQSLTIPKGTAVILPVNAIHYDPIHYPDPYTFDPSRFSESGRKERHKYSFLAFGEGPRICLGQKFGLFQVKAAIAALLRNFNFSLNQKTAHPFVISKRTFVRAIESGLWVNFEKRITQSQ